MTDPSPSHTCGVVIFHSKCSGAGIFADKNFKEKSGIFAAEPSAGDREERARNSVLFERIVDDMRHSGWPALLQALREDDDPAA